MGQSAEDKAKAEAIVSTWVWQPADGHNYRFQYSVRTLTRFYESVSMQPDEIRLVVDYLREQEVSTGISFLNKNVDLGGSWKAKDAWFQTMPGEKFGGSESTKIRIYQVLFQSASGQSGDGPYTIENGCQYKVQHTFYWDVESIPALPASSSGDEYALQGLTRDKETGLFSCVIERKERVQQDVSEYASGQTIFEQRREEQHIGVKQQNVSGTGKQASAGGGQTVSRKITKNPDCTSNVENETVIETPVQQAVVKLERTLEGNIRTTKHVNQPSPSGQVPSKPGSSVTNEKKPGGSYDQTIVEADETPLGIKARSCEKTIFEHVDSKTENVPDDPGIQHGSAGVGTIVEYTSSMTRYGTWDKTEKTTVEAAVQDATKEFKKTLRGKIVTTSDRNQSAPLTGSGMKVGEVRRSEKTRSGLYINTKSEVANEAVGVIRKTCERTTLTHSDEQTSNVVDEPQVVEQIVEVNKRKTRAVRQTDDGTWDDTEQVVTFEPTQRIETWSDGYGTYVHCVYRNQPNPIKPVSGDRISCQFSMNDHGSYDGSYSITSTDSASAGGKVWSKLANLSTKIYYQKPGGKLVSRTVSAQAKYIYGNSKSVIDEVKDGESCSLCRWVSGFRLIGTDFAHGEKYTNITIGPEDYVP